MTDDELLTTLADQIAALADGVEAVMENQRLLVARLDEQAGSLAAIGVAVGMTGVIAESGRKRTLSWCATDK